MEKLETFLIFVTFVSLTVQNPLIQNIGRDRVENKNWKVGLYTDNDSPKSYVDPPTTYRLPNNTLPIRYDIFIKTDVHQPEFIFDGLIKIQIRAVDVTDYVTLHYRDLDIKRVSLLDLNGEVVDGNLDFEYVEPFYFEFLRISLGKFMAVNEIFVLEISYEGILNEKQIGFYRAYYEENDQVIYYGITQFEATEARLAFPCYDEPGIRTPFAFQMQHHKNYTAWSNMELIEVDPVNGTDYVISKFYDTPPMQTYLLAFLVAPFEYISSNNTKIPQKIIAKPSSIRNGEADFANTLTGPILETLETHLNVNFSLPKLDHAAITQFEVGAMENWGLVTYREAVLLFRPTGYPPIDEMAKIRMVTVMAHEDAHQFFGNLVSPHWWTDLWLNEGFASLYEYYIPHLLYPDDGYMDLFREREFLQLFDLDVPTSTKSVPLSHYVESPKDISSRFDDISYSKGGVIMRMFQEAYTVQMFTKGVTNYLNEMAFKAAKPADFFAAMELAYQGGSKNEPGTFSYVMGSWIYQAGYPLVSVSVKGDTLVFTQRRYPTGNGEIYAIPMTFATRHDPNFENKIVKFYLLDESMEIHKNLMAYDSNDWIIFNNQQIGYYRVSYSPELWLKIAAGLRENHNAIDKINREVLMDELYIGYSELSELQASTALDVLLYLTDEENVRVWSRADRSLELLRQSLFGTDAYDDYLMFLQHITAIQIERLGFEDPDGEPVDRLVLRSVVARYNCEALSESCLEHETEKFEVYMEDREMSRAPNFCLAFRNVTLPIHIQFLNELASDPESPDRLMVVSGVSCSLSISNLRTLLFIVEDHGNALTPYERTMIIENMLASSAVGLEVGFEYLDRNYDKISLFIESLKKAVNTQEYSDKLDELLDNAIAEEFISEESAEELRYAVRRNMEWQERHMEDVSYWFDVLYGRIETTENPQTEESTESTTVSQTEESTTVSKTTDESTVSQSTTDESTVTQSSEGTTEEGSTRNPTTTPDSGAADLFGSLIFVTISIILTKLFS